MKARQAKGILRHGYSRGRMGKREDLGNLFVRSSWEANYARYLEWSKRKGEIIDWSYESKIFEFHAVKRGHRSYIPDFEVLCKDGNKEYHEVKGWMDRSSKIKLAYMAQYYPEVRIVLVDKAAYDLIRKLHGKNIPFWE
jgi:hypothetical protein